MTPDHDALLAYLAERRLMPFAWGRDRNDCVSYGAGALLAMTGWDPLAGMPHWSTERGALRVMRRFGGLVAAVTGRLSPIAPALAHRGDVAGVPDEAQPGGVRLMIVEGALISGPGDRGAVLVPRAAMICAWSAPT